MRGLWKTHLGDDVAYDPRYHDNARIEIASFVSEPPALVLDVGCGGGATGKVLKQKFPGVRVIGIESNPRAAEHARAFLDDVIGEPIDTAPLFRPEAVDRYIVARRPGRLTTKNLSISFRDREDLEDLYAFQYVIDARATELVHAAEGAAGSRD